MKTLHLYLTKQVLISLALTVTVFAFVLLLGNVLKEIIGLLVSGRVSFGLVMKAIGLLVPFVMSYVLPFAMLTAVILVFGRFSADQELTAVRASGISLISLTTPILLLSLFLCGLCAWFNMSIAPQCRGAYKNIIFELSSRSIVSLITEDRFNELPGKVLYIRKKNGDNMEDVRLYSLENGQIKTRTSAKSGTIRYDEASQSIYFELTNLVSEARFDRNPIEEEQFIGPPAPEKPTDWQTLQYGALATDPINLKELMNNDRKPKLSEMTLPKLMAERKRLEEVGIDSMPARVQIHRQIAFSFASFAFTLIGIPLAIQAHRRETSVGVAIALGLVLVYYAFFIAGEALATKENLKPYLLMWAPNFLFQAIGALLLKRASHG